MSRLASKFLFVTIILASKLGGALYAQNTETTKFEDSDKWKAILAKINQATITDSLPAPALFTEPVFTRDTINAIRFTIPPLDSIPPTIRNDIREYLVLRDVWIDTSPGSIPVPIRDSSDTNPRLEVVRDRLDTTYNYALRLYIENSQGDMFISNFSDTTHSTQDNVAPELDEKSVEIPQLESTPVEGWLNRSSFEVLGDIFDQAGVWKAFLYRRNIGESDWVDRIEISFDSTLTGSGFVFSPSANPRFQVLDIVDGKWEYRIEGKDATHTPVSDSSKFVLAGNENVPEPSDTAHVRINIDTTPPDSVTLNCEQDGDAIVIHWSAASDSPGVGVDKYEIFRDDSLIAIVDDTVTTYTDSDFDITIAHVFEYQVLPIDSLGNDQENGGLASCAFVPRGKITMQSEPDYTKGNSNIVCWTPSDPGLFASYVLFFATDSDTMTGDTTKVSHATVCDTIDNLEEGIPYSYWVVGIDTFSRKVESVNRVSSTQDATPPEFEITDPLLDSTNQSAVKVAFRAEDTTSAAVDSAFLWYRLATAQAWIPVDTLNLPDTSPVDSMFIFDFAESNDGENGVYEFFVGGNDTAWAADNSGRMGNKSIPAAPMDSILYDTMPPDTVILECKQVENTIELWWNTPVDTGIGIIKEYKVFRDETLLVTLTAADTHYVDMTINPARNDTFHYQVRAVDLLGNEQTEGGRAWCPFWGIPRITMILEPEFTVGDSNTVCWSPDRIFADFWVFRAQDLDSMPDDSINTQDTCVTFTGLDKDVRYYYWVRGEDEHGRFVVSDTVHSTQDASPPETMVDPLSLCLTARFDLLFQAWDTTSASVDSARLYFRYDSTSEWQSADHLLKDLDETVRAVAQDTALTDSIRFVPEQDGYVEFYVAGKDTARAADAVPGSLLTGDDGNWGRPQPSTRAQASTYVDTEKPFSEVVNLDSVQKSLCFRVPFHADDRSKDGYESGLKKVTLFCKFGSEAEFAPCDTLYTLPGDTAAVDSFFNFTATKGDGRYIFYTLATDSCGNVQMPISPTDTTYVTGTPIILAINPPNESFNFAADVDAIEICFDRPVSPIDGREWSDVITIKNRYDLDRPIACTFEFDPVSEDTFKVICKTDSIFSTGSYEIWVNKGLIIFENSQDCDVLPSVMEHFNFYTYMEAGQGGQITTGEVTIFVPSGHPVEDVVIKFEETEAICTPTGFEQASNLCFTIKAKLQPNEDYSGRIPGRLCLHYDDLPTGMNPETVRVFEQIGDRCRLASASRILPVDLSAQFACTDLENLQGTFCLFGQSPDFLSQQKRLSNYPNPLSTDGTTITYLLEQSGTDVSIRIFDLFGNLVRTFTNVTNNEGLNTCPWDGLNDMGEKAANGGYICVMVVSGQEKYRRKIGVMW